MKGSIAVRHHSTLVVTVSEGKIDFGPKGYDQVNVYHIDSHYTGAAHDFLMELHEAMPEGNHDNSDIMTDYFDVGWYTDIQIGKWDKPYVLQ